MKSGLTKIKSEKWVFFSLHFPNLNNEDCCANIDN